MATSGVDQETVRTQTLAVPGWPLRASGSFRIPRGPSTVTAPATRFTLPRSAGCRRNRAPSFGVLLS